MTVLNLQVSAAADDVFHTAQFNWNVVTTNAWIGNSGGTSGDRWSRFTNVTIPPGSTINAATEQFYSNSAGAANGFATTIKCDASDNSTVPADGTAWSSRTFTTGTAWTMTSPYTTGAFITTADFTADVQAIINRPGWSSGNAISTDTRDNGSPANADIVAETYEGVPGNAAKLDITYTAATPASPTAFIALPKRKGIPMLGGRFLASRLTGGGASRSSGNRRRRVIIGGA